MGQAVQVSASTEGQITIRLPDGSELNVKLAEAKCLAQRLEAACGLVRSPWPANLERRGDAS